MKYEIGSTMLINNTEWEIMEYRVGRGKEWIYTLKKLDGSVDSDGNAITMSLNEDAMNGVSLNGQMTSVLGSV